MNTNVRTRTRARAQKTESGKRNHDTVGRPLVKIRELQSHALDRELIQRHRITVEGVKGVVSTH